MMCPKWAIKSKNKLDKLSKIYATLAFHWTPLICHIQQIKHEKLTFRKLCIEALVEEGDLNHDWRLNSIEFLKIMDKNYKTSNKCK